MRKTILVFALLIFGLLLLFQIGKYSLISGDLKLEIIVASIAMIFFFVGIYINKKSLYQKSVSKDHEIDSKKIEELELTQREYEVLKLISKGLSNKEVADSLFLSESTIKTYVSNLLLKLNAKRRTQAIEIAKQLQII